MNAMLDKDLQLNENQTVIMNKMIEDGMDEREAKLRVLCIAAPPDHFHTMPNRGLQYPRMVYHADGRLRVAQNKEEHEKAKAAGWIDTPMQIHLNKLQTPNAKISLSFCPKCDADTNGAKFCSNCGQSVMDDTEFQVPASAAIAVERQRKAEERRAKV